MNPHQKAYLYLFNQTSDIIRELNASVTYWLENRPEQPTVAEHHLLAAHGQAMAHLRAAQQQAEEIILQDGE